MRLNYTLPGGIMEHSNVLSFAGDDAGGDDIVERINRDLAEQFAIFDDELAFANARIEELSAQLIAIAQDAQYWVDRAEFEEKLKLADAYGQDQYCRGECGEPSQTLVEWLAEQPTA